MKKNDAHRNGAAIEPPKALSVVAENIPEELKKLPQWVTWKYVFREGKWTKPPYQVKGRKLASSTDPETWGHFEDALKTYQSKRVDGIGFVVSANEELVGIDLDHCFDLNTRTGEPWAIDIGRKVKSYSEFSPSGEGIRIFAKGSLPNGHKGKKKGNIEIYSAERYLTVTGHRLKNAPLTIEARQEQITWLWDTYCKEKPKAERRANGNGAWTPGDEELLAKAFEARNGEKLKRLFDGDVGNYPSQSEADLALCSLLAFWAADEAQLDRLFRRSALMRDKWDQKHGATSYGERTTGKAWADRTEHYQVSEHLTPKPNGAAVNQQDGVNQEEPEPRIEMPALPECAWQGPFSIWDEIVTPCTESPREYLWASCLVTIGLVLGRNIRIENPRPLFPNFYIILIGSTGDDRKSTALYFAGHGLDELGMGSKVDILRGIQSSEAIYDSLARMDGAKSLAYCDEFRSLLSVAKRKGTQDLIPRLSSLYYCPPRDSLNRHKDSTVVVDPFLSLIAATPTEYVQDLLSNLEIDGGFLNRFLTITGEVKQWKPIAPRPSGWEKFTKLLLEIGSHYDDNECRFEWTEESRDLWIRHYTAWKESRRSWNERDRKLTARIDEHILKLAIVYSAIKKQSVVTVEALITAISIGQWLQTTALNAFREVGQDPFGRAEKTVLDIVKSKGKMRRRYLQQWVYKKGINGEILTRVITSLVKNGELKEMDGWVGYVPPGDREGD
jgi:putative DNA primase/helicase